LRLFSFTVVLSILAGFAIAPGRAADHSSLLSDSVIVDAKPDAVWSAIRQFRRSSPNRTLLQENKQQALIEERFADLPIIGDAKAVIREMELPPNQIDYSLVKSDKLTAFEGSWFIVPSPDGKSTLVKLSSRTETGLHVPFSQCITRQSTSKELRCRLAAIKRLAESK
jgi:hypothetical protein